LHREFFSTNNGTKKLRFPSNFMKYNRKFFNFILNSQEYLYNRAKESVSSHFKMSDKINKNEENNNKMPISNSKKIIKIKKCFFSNNKNLHYTSKNKSLIINKAERFFSTKNRIQANSKDLSGCIDRMHIGLII